MKKTYKQPVSEAMDLCVESRILANSIEVDASKKTDVMFSHRREFGKSIWDSNED